LSETDRALVEVFCSRLSAAFDNVILYEQLQAANAHLEERVAQRTRELTRANARLGAQREQLRQSNKLKGEILGTVAHDLKNPLGVILGRAEILSDLLEAESVQRDAAQAQVGHIRDSAKRLTGMVDLLISDAMNDALDITVRREPLDLAALAAEVVEANRPLAERKQQGIALQAPDALPAVGDQDRLRDAIDNLVSNAIKYSPPGGAIEVGLRQEDSRIRVSVRDYGPGLSPEDLSRLFGRFQRLSAKPTGGESSTGLGLSIAKRIVELHGGEIEAASGGPGTGTTFAIVLPSGETTR
jgi:signal transduction histidine kinase